LKRFLTAALLLAAPAAFAQDKSAPRKLNPGIYARFETSMGNFMCELYQFQAPNAVANFIGLAEGTKDWTDPKTGRAMKAKRFYDNTTFHRIIDRFMIQGGDPTGTGLGGPGYRFNDEISRTLKHDREGRLSMANSGPNTNGSQFFITLGPVSQLDGKYTLFGQVIDGMDVVRKIGKVPVEVPRGGREKSHPVMPVTLKKVTIERVK
jgi:peptidyl-prolyl cis-trans isomerase A (cyclophilin A)